jgi:hypothetical protein
MPETRRVLNAMNTLQESRGRVMESNMKQTRRIEKAYTKVGLREHKGDFAYWQTQPYLARLAALEQIRQEYHQWKYRAEPRLPRRRCTDAPTAPPPS